MIRALDSIFFVLYVQSDAGIRYSRVESFTGDVGGFFFLEGRLIRNIWVRDGFSLSGNVTFLEKRCIDGFMGCYMRKRER